MRVDNNFVIAAVGVGAATVLFVAATRNSTVRGWLGLNGGDTGRVREARGGQQQQAVSRVEEQAREVDEYKNDPNRAKQGVNTNMRIQLGLMRRLLEAREGSTEAQVENLERNLNIMFTHYNIAANGTAIVFPEDRTNLDSVRGLFQEFGFQSQLILESARNPQQMGE